MTIEIRHMRYVVSVAEHGTFSRAAEHLGIAQPALSQQVLKVERELGFDLFVRHPRGATPTASGAEFIADARAALSAFDDAVGHAARQSKGETGTIVVGFGAAAGLELTPLILAAFADRFPEVEVDLREYSLADPSAGLVDRTADASFVRPPLGARGLWYDVLMQEPRVVALPSSHRLAARHAVSVLELLDEPMVASRTTDAVSEAFWLLTEHRDGVPPRIVARAETYETELQLVAAGKAISISCAASARFFARPGVVYVPIDDVAPSEIALGHRAGEANVLVQNFLSVARSVRDAAATSAR